MKTVSYKFKKGDLVRLDDIYEIQALAGGDWWERAPDAKDPDSGEDLIITKDVEIRISWEKVRE